MPHEKDVSEKLLEDYNDVFADILNSTLFDGREVVKADELENAVTVSQLKLLDGLHEQERDTAKYWKQGAVIIATFGSENQTLDDPVMPLRVIGYDGAVYKGEVNRYHSERRQKLPLSPLYPAVTVVLYFGTTHWKGPRSLRECFPNLHEELKPFVPDYPIHVVEVAFLKPEEVKKMKSDFRFVADYLVQTRTGGKYIPPDDRIIHVDETLKLMGAITGDRRFQDAVNAVGTGEKEGVSMYNVIDSYIDLGFEKGRKEGFEKGREEGQKKGLEEGRAEGREESRKEYEAVLAEKDRTLAALAREIEELKQRYGAV